MHAFCLNHRNAAARLITAAALPTIVLLALASPSSAAEKTTVKFQLKADPLDASVVKVVESFTLKQGEKAFIQPPPESVPAPYGAPAPVVEVQASQNSPYTLESLSPPGSGWAVTANSAGQVAVTYTVRFTDANRPRSDAEAPGGAVPPRAISGKDLRVFRGSDVLLCPREAPGGAPLSTSFAVDVLLGSGQKALAPWKPAGTGGSSFSVAGESQLLDNYIAWGDIELVKARASKTDVTLGYSSDFAKLTSAERSSYTSALSALLERLDKTLGGRPSLGNLAVVLCSEKRAGLSAPASGTMLGSVVICTGGKTLEGAAAAAAADGFFELWNRFSLVPKPGGDAAWFQAGLPQFYPMRVAALAGLMDSDAAYTEFSRVYRAYLTDPSAMNVSLAAAEGRQDERALLARKGAALCASLSRKLTNDSKGSAKDIDWLLGQMAQKYDHFDGKDYSLVDISELLEGATGTSWDRYFDGRVRGTQAVLSSEFSGTDLFGSTSSLGRPLVVGKGSGRSWIYLVIAVVIILLVPIVFSTYVRRAVQLDLTMPKILPDDDDDD